VKASLEDVLGMYLKQLVDGRKQADESEGKNVLGSVNGERVSIGRHCASLSQ
jgi:hypothetical protein